MDSLGRLLLWVGALVVGGGAVWAWRARRGKGPQKPRTNPAIAAGARLAAAALPAVQVEAGGLRLGHRPARWRDRLSVLGAEVTQMSALTTLLALGGLGLVWRGGPDGLALGLAAALLAFGMAPLLVLQGMVRWRAFVDPTLRVPHRVLLGVGAIGVAAGCLAFALGVSEAGWWLRAALAVAAGAAGAGGALVVWRGRRPEPEQRVWLAREGIVEEQDQGVLLFPWGAVKGFDVVEAGGAMRLRVWFLRQRLGEPFVLVKSDLAPRDRERWLARRLARLERGHRQDGSPLVLEPEVLEGGMGAVVRQLERIARSPEATEALPSVHRDPPPLNLATLGATPRQEP